MSPCPSSALSPEEKEALSQEIANARKVEADSSEASRRQAEALQQKLSELIAKNLAGIQEREDALRHAAMRLAYLGGDDAVRAKVRFIIADEENGDGNPISPIMVDGLPSSGNFQLQLDLLQAAWHDPNHVPTSVLQTALREAKELLSSGVVTDEGLMWAGTDLEREPMRERYQGELNEIIATLPQRTPPNRSKTIAFLKSRACRKRFPDLIQQRENA